MSAVAAEPDEDGRDAAWVTVETTFDAQWLRDFLGDIERLYRINSLMEFEDLRPTGPSRFRMKARNLSNGIAVDTGLAVTPHRWGIDVTYSNGIKTATRFRVEPTPGGAARLVVTDDYSGTPEAEREARIAEVDKSLTQWGRDLHRYFRLWKRWSALPGWRWYMRRVWQPMKPSARRISSLLVIITIAEFLVFLAVFSVFWLELDRFLG